MTDVSVKQLAELVRTTPERLLEQLKEAGVNVAGVNQTISDTEKRKLLLHLKKSHGVSEASKRSKITLQRKKISVVKQGKKSVNVEFRAKRTYVKPSAVEEKEKLPEVEQEVVVQQAAPVVEAPTITAPVEPAVNESEVLGTIEPL